MVRCSGTTAAPPQEPVRVSIPRYFLRGQGKDEHFEFEVKVSVAPPPLITSPLMFDL